MQNIILEKEKEEIFKQLETIELQLYSGSFYELSANDQDLLKDQYKELKDKYSYIKEQEKIKDIDSTASIVVDKFTNYKEYIIRKSRHDLKVSYSRLRQKDLDNELFRAVEYVYYLHTKNTKSKKKLSWKSIFNIVSKEYNIPIETIRSEWSRRINYMRYAEKNLLL